MMKRKIAVYLAAITFSVVSLKASNVSAQTAGPETFQSVVKLVDQQSKLIILSDSDGASIAVWPAMQGRVLTSSAEGEAGHSFGFVNRSLIESGKAQPHMNAVGGEDRLWIGPEGGQFSIFFAPKAPFDLDHWYTPAPVDAESFNVVSQTKTSVALTKEFPLTNYSGTSFRVRIDREVRLLPADQVWHDLHMTQVPGVKVVGFESDNRMTNIALSSWSKATGLLSLWVLGQFTAAPSAAIVLPIREGSTAELGIPVTTDYFGVVPADRIAITPKYVVLKADAHYRSKLGVSPQRSKGVLGSYDPENHVLTIVQYSQPEHEAMYVNSAWKIQENPFSGDVANCYNDGPLAPGKPGLGSFYEMESSSPALVLASHESVQHVHRTIHIVGPAKQLDKIARAVLGVPLSEIRLPQS
jgi:hypothetical protein